jgi:HEAT repeat protein
MLRDDPPHELYLANYSQSNDSARDVLENLFATITVQQLPAAARHRIEDEPMALKVLGVMGKHAPPDLIKSILDDEHRDRWLRRQARQMLHKAGVLLPRHYFWAEDGLSHELVDPFYATDTYYPTAVTAIDEVTIAQMRELGPHAPMQELFAFFDAAYHERHNSDEQVARTIIEVLQELAPYRALEEVVALLDHSNPLARRGAARILTAFAERAPINKLVAMLHNPEEERIVRLTIIQTLSELHAYTPGEALTTLLHDSDVLRDYIFYQEVCCALKPWGKNIPLEPLLALMHGTDGEFDWRHAISALGLLQERAPLDLRLTLLQREDKGESDCALPAVCSLGKDIPLDIVLPRLPGIWCGSDIVRALTEMGEDLPLARLLRMVDDQDEDACAWVIDALGDFAEAAPVQFVALAKGDVRPFSRVALMKALAKLGQDAPVELALAAFADPHPDVCRQARIALLQLHVDPTLIPLEPLLAALQEQSIVQEPGDYRYESNRHESELAWLATCGTPVPVASLLAFLGDLDPAICEHAASALYHTHPEACGEVAQQAEAILRGAPAAGVFASRMQSRIARRVSLIEHANPEVLALLSDLLDWPYWQVRVEAATTLANIHRNMPDRAIRRLLELRLDPASQAVREAADHALVEILSRENGMEDASFYASSMPFSYLQCARRQSVNPHG